MTRRARRRDARSGTVTWWWALLVLVLVAFVGSRHPDILEELRGASEVQGLPPVELRDPAAGGPAAPAADGDAVATADADAVPGVDSEAEPRAGTAVELEGSLTVAVNAARRQRGVPELASHPSLASAARAHSLDMAAAGLCRHQGSNGSDVGTRLRLHGYPAVAFAENIACGADTPAEAVSLWLGSKAHRDNLLGRQFTELGTGFADGSERVWTLVLGDR